MTDTLTTARRLTIVKHLAGGKDLDTVAMLTKLDRSTVLDVGSHHGYPSTDLMQRAVGLLEDKIERDNAPTEHPNAAAIEREQRVAHRPAAGASTPPAAGRTVPLTQPDEIRVLVNTSKGHPSKRVQGAAEKVLAAVERLRELIREDEAKHAERRRQEAERAAARAEVERLEAQLRAAKAKLRGPKPTTTRAKSPKAAAVATGDYACNHADCGRSFASSQARAMHRRRAHEGFDPNAVHKAAS